MLILEDTNKWHREFGPNFTFSLSVKLFQNKKAFKKLDKQSRQIKPLGPTSMKEPAFPALLDPSSFCLHWKSLAPKSPHAFITSFKK